MWFIVNIFNLESIYYAVGGKLWKLLRIAQ